jgi:uncharacterized protein YbdZ (MbtH family)
VLRGALRISKQSRVPVSTQLPSLTRTKSFIPLGNTVVQTSDGEKEQGYDWVQVEWPLGPVLAHYSAAGEGSVWPERIAALDGFAFCHRQRVVDMK